MPVLYMLPILLFLCLVCGANSAVNEKNNDLGVAGNEIRGLAVPVLHRMHEGSHAIGPAIGTVPCVIFIDEVLDRRMYKTNKEYYEMLQMFFDPDGVNVIPFLTKVHSVASKFNQEVRNSSIDDGIQQIKTCKSSRVLIIVCALVRFSPELLRAIKETKPKLTYFSIARTDLMRYSLSISKGEEIRLGSKHPQFNSNISKSAHSNVKITHSMIDMKQSAEKVISYWKSTFDDLKLIKSIPGYTCANFKLLAYEDFLLNPSDFTNRFYNSAIKNRRKYGQSAYYVQDAGIKTSFHKVQVSKTHSTDISDFVENAAEVVQHFLISKYLSFSDVLLSSNFACSADQFSI